MAKMLSVLFYLLICCFIYSSGQQPTKLSTLLRACDASKDVTDCLSINMKNIYTYFGSGKSPYKVPLIDPLNLAGIRVLTIGKAITGTQIYKNMSVDGLTDIANMVANFNRLNSQFLIDTYHTKVTVTTDYEHIGKFFDQHVQGSGVLKITFDNVTVNQHFYTWLIPKNRNLHFNVIFLTIKIVPEKATFKYTGLRNLGNNVDDVVNKAVNEKWKEVFDDVGFAFNYAFSIGIKNWAQSVGEYVTFDTLFA